MSFDLRSAASLALLLALLLTACTEDLVVDLDDADKDRLAAFVERDGAPEVGDLIDFTPSETTAYGHLDHLAWDAIARRYNQDGQLAYSDFAADPDSVELLDTYLALLASADPDALDSDTERLAFWLNAYNALVFREAARRRAADPAFSVADDDFAFFKTRTHIVGGELYSLDQLEHGIVRGDRTHASVADLDDAAWAPFASRHTGVFAAGPTDPRVHIGLNCASRSCPRLPAYAYTAATLNDALDTQTADFVADPTRGAGPDGISMLFVWFESDFAATHTSPRGFIEAFRADVSGVNFDATLEYDWTLNGE